MEPLPKNQSINWNQDSNLVAKAEHQSEELQNGAKKTRELQVHLVKDARHLNLCSSKVFAVKLENMYINPLSAKPSFQLWYPGGQRLKVISFS